MPLLLFKPPIFYQIHNFNSHFASISKVHRNVFPRKYPTMLINADGSTYTIRYEEPRKLIRLPVDVNSLSEEEKILRAARMKPKATIKHHEQIKEKIEPMKYVKYMKNMLPQKKQSNNV